jgi:antirestriction protein
MEQPASHEQQPILENEELSEREPRSEPRIYVASLTDYNDGRLYGAWFDAALDPADLTDAVRGMLERSPTPGAEEWAIHDYESFGPVRLSEFEDLATISRIAKGITEHGPAFAHFATICDSTDLEDLDRFEDAYLGHFDSIEDYAEELLDDIGVDELLDRAVPDSLRAYVKLDVEAFARDLQYSGDVTGSEGNNGVYLFDQNR